MARLERVVGGGRGAGLLRVDWRGIVLASVPLPRSLGPWTITWWGDFSGSLYVWWGGGGGTWVKYIGRA